MKKFMRIVLALVAVLAVSMPASAQFRWGVRAGVNINSLHFSKEQFKNDVISSENRAGFVGGLTTEFTVPIVGIGFDASLLYAHRVNNVTTDPSKVDPTTGALPESTKGDYLEIPINLKYKIGLPVVGKIISPYLTTGPSFAVLCSKKAIVNGFEQKAFDVAWNVGLGVQLVNHLQLGASYGFGLSKGLSHKLGANEAGDVGRTKCWTVTAAYLF